MYLLLLCCLDSHSLPPPALCLFVIYFQLRSSALSEEGFAPVPWVGRGPASLTHESNCSPNVTSLTLAGIMCMLENKCQTTNFPVLCIGVSALGVDRGWSFPLPHVRMGMFTVSPCFTDKEHNALIFHLNAIYILHRDSEGGGDTDWGSFRPYLSLTHN